MKKPTRQARLWLWLTIPIAALTAYAAANGLFNSGLYVEDAPSLVAQALGQDLITLVVALPTLIISMIYAYQGSTRGRLVWLGSVTYLLYTYISYSVMSQFNAMFLAYVGISGLALYALIGGIVSTDREAVVAAFGPRTPRLIVGVFMVLVAALFYWLWLSDVLPAVQMGTAPQSVLEADIPTNPIHVLDMAWILPAMVIGALALFRKRPLGYIIAGALLSYAVLLALAINAMVVAQAIRGFEVVLPQIVIFAAMLILSGGMLYGFLRNADAKEPAPVAQQAPAPVAPIEPEPATLTVVDDAPAPAPIPGPMSAGETVAEAVTTVDDLPSVGETLLGENDEPSEMPDLVPPDAADQEDDQDASTIQL